jgi:dTDP-4-amino-4,6-dideoxy-D-galactose acyltransferase
MRPQQTPWIEDTFLGRALGYPVFRLREPDSARQAIAAAASGPRWMIETRVPVEDVELLGDLTTLGFRLIDTNVQLTRAPQMFDTSGTEHCRMAGAQDEPAVRSIAAQSFSQSRFHLDPLIPAAAANRIKEEWAGGFFAGRRGEWMVVGEGARGVHGFTQLLRAADDTLVIDLLAVKADGRNQGFARAMIAYAATACLGRPALLKVGTQIANVNSLSLYTSLGFRVCGASYVLHLHAENLVA